MAEIPLDVRELPGGFFKIEPAVGGLPGEALAGTGDPAILVNGPIGEHCEVLRGSPVFGSRIVERVDHADPLDRLLRDAIDGLGGGHLTGFVNGGADVQQRVEPSEQFPLCADSLGPNHSPARSARLYEQVNICGNKVWNHPEGSGAGNQRVRGPQRLGAVWIRRWNP